ncbi:thiopeptide-type bacteriocin biosynthesis protein [Nocardiopsis nanhaiensis]
MPAHRLNGPPSGSGPAAAALARVLAGTPLEHAAGDAHMEPAFLARLLEVFNDAGYRAVHEATAHHSWWQVDVEFDPHRDHTAARRLTALIDTALADGLVSRWWFLHKHPGWRLRLDPAQLDTRHRLAIALDTLVDTGVVRGWWTGPYEAETAAFGGPTGMDIAHEVFCADSHHIRRLPAEADLSLGRKQLSLMLCTELMRSAGLEPFEHGDVWDLVCDLRPLPKNVNPARIDTMLTSTKTLIGADTDPDGAMFGPDGALSAHTSWAGSFATAGARLGRARAEGTLVRGIRAVLAYHVIFHWNRLALGPGVQAALARAARTVVLGVAVESSEAAR